MAANTLESIQPYVEQLFDDSDVQKHLARATANLRGARSRAGNAKSKKKALQDPTAAPAAGQHRAGGGRGRRRHPEGAGEEGARAAAAAGSSCIAAIGAGAYVATNEEARTKLLGLDRPERERRPATT